MRESIITGLIADARLSPDEAAEYLAGNKDTGTPVSEATINNADPSQEEARSILAAPDALDKYVEAMTERAYACMA